MNSLRTRVIVGVGRSRGSERARAQRSHARHVVVGGLPPRKDLTRVRHVVRGPIIDAVETDAIRSAIEDFIAAYNRGDVDSLMSIYTDDLAKGRWAMEGGPDHGRRDLILDRLKGFPAILQNVVSSTAEDLWRRRPEAGGFALIEHAWHLADLEEEGFGARIERILNESNPSLPDFKGDEAARLRRYLDQAMKPAIIRFAATRAANVTRLQSIAESDWSQNGTQELVGEITLQELPASMLRHDIAHANELVELLRELGVAVPEALAAVAGLEPLARSA